jgi:hypothetical protein
MMRTIHSYRTRYRFVLLLLAIMIGLLFSSACQSDQSAAPVTGYLRGGTILILELPMTRSRPEIIAVGDEKVASRSFVPRSSPVAINSVTIPTAMWQNLEALRRTWCEQPPACAIGTPSDSHYKLTFNCGRIRNPVLSVPPDQLPSVLGDLVGLVPSAP